MSKDKMKRKYRKKFAIRRSSCGPNNCPVVSAWQPSESGCIFVRDNMQESNRKAAAPPHSKQVAEYKSAKSYKLKIVKFQTTEIIDGVESLNLIDRPRQPDSNAETVRKIRCCPETVPRIEMIDDKDTPTNRLAFGVIFDNWVKVANFRLPAEAGDSYLVHESCSSEPTKPKKSMPEGDKISGSESNKEIRERSSHNKKATAVSSLVKYDYRPSYKDTVASKMRYEYRRNKKVCPYYIIQHVMKYQRPPFWNYTKMSKGFSSFLTREQLRKICDI